MEYPNFSSQFVQATSKVEDFYKLLPETLFSMFSKHISCATKMFLEMKSDRLGHTLGLIMNTM